MAETTDRPNYNELHQALRALLFASPHHTELALALQIGGPLTVAEHERINAYRDLRDSVTEILEKHEQYYGIRD